MTDGGSGGGADKRERGTTPQHTSAGVAVALALLAVPLLPIMCLSGLALVMTMAPSEPCRPPFVQDPSDCGPEPLALLPTALLAGGYGTAAIVLALRTGLPPWVRIGALCAAPVVAVPLLWALFV
ncbi:hypothetical protein ONO23_03485 [Micromonospora noduli]|uniref:hypothetical protein n=1 Tax=Micromonospora noduli TaxID=709876 RepID=UPI000DBF9CA0|nr:hypothetical protein [Micromonospora noduli]RAO31725.1 hypothetical protein ONO23_03485 [Micromonospora noduli]